MSNSRVTTQTVVPFRYPGRLYHCTPAWVGGGALFHIRIRARAAANLLTEPERATGLLEAARQYNTTGQWWCTLILLMPDHLHALVSFPTPAGMSETIRQWKRGTARLHRVHWQEGYFDHRLRTERESCETWDYIRRNPVVRNFCPSEAAWPWQWSPSVSVNSA